MKIKINIILMILALSMTLFISCKKEPENEETLNPIEKEEEANEAEIENKEDENEEEASICDIIHMNNALVEEKSVLVPARIFSEELGAEVTWNSQKKTMLIEKEGNSVLFKIDSRLINYNNGKDYELSHTKPRLFNPDGNGDLMTYVPLQIISKALNLEAIWNEDEKNIYINHENRMEEELALNVEIISQDKNDIINGKTILQVNTKRNMKKVMKFNL